MQHPINVKPGYRFGATPYPLRIKNPDGTLFGWKHHGQDYPAKIGTKVVAPQSGKVVLAGRNGSAGNEVRIQSGSTVSRLLHLNQIVVKVGQTVKQGQQVGTSGNTGFTTGPHLHWSVSKSGKYVDPIAQIYVAPKPIYYIVRSGDTMTAIAKKHGLTLTKLKALNPQIKDINKISIGQKVRVR